MDLTGIMTLQVCYFIHNLLNNPWVISMNLCLFVLLLYHIVKKCAFADTDSSIRNKTVTHSP
jgi:hypothetical protein